MARQRRQLEQIREELPTNSAMLLNTNQGLSAPRRGLSSTPCKASCTLLGEGGTGHAGGQLHLYSTSQEAWDVPGGSSHTQM